MKAKGKLAELKEDARGSVAGSRAAGRLEESHWLCPVEDRRAKGSVREGMLAGFSLGSYLLLVDYTSRLCRQGKARVSREVAGIFARLDSSAEFWEQRLKKMFVRSRLLGSYFATDRRRLHCSNWQRVAACIIWITWLPCPRERDSLRTKLLSSWRPSTFTDSRRQSRPFHTGARTSN